MRTFKVVVVDDSAFMRKSLSTMIDSHPHLSVVATARDGKDGVELVKKHRPDVVTMDIEMPVMDGLTALSIIMKECPTPVMMLSSLTTQGATATLDALERGAVDFIPKELSYVSLDIVKIKEMLHQKLIAIAMSKPPSPLRCTRPSSSAVGGLTTPSTVVKSAATSTGLGHARQLNELNAKSLTNSFAAVVLGISTGGPQALMRIAPKFPAQLPVGIVVVQHMPPKFTASFADRLNSVCPLRVKEAEDQEVFEAGTIYIAPGGMHLTMQRSGMRMMFRIGTEPASSIYKPSVDIMMNSAVEQFRRPLLGVIMTGMGKDGLEGLKNVKLKGGYVLAQSEESCVVYGMPRAVIEAQVSDFVADVDDIPTAISRLILHD